MFGNIFVTSLLSIGIVYNANSSTITREFMNSTDYEFTINYDNTKTLNPHSYKSFEQTPAFFTDLEVYCVSRSGKPSGVYYWINQVDNEQEVLLTFSEIPVAYTYRADLPDLTSSTINGIQFFQKKSIVGETYYLLNGDISNSSSVNTGNLIEGKSATINNRGVTSLSWSKTHVDKGLTAYVSWEANGSSIANNSMTNGGTSVEELTNIVLYNEGWNNRLTFTSGYYGRAYNIQGYLDLNPTLFSKEFVGYASRASSGDISISLEPMVVGFDLVGMALSSIGSFLSYMVAPGITIGLLLMVPIIITLLLFILKLVKKG